MDTAAIATARPGDAPPVPASWHALPAERALAALATSLDGLEPAEAERRLAFHGPNRLAAAAGKSALRRFAEQFNNALIYFLLAAAVIAFALGHHVDAAVIVAVVLINALVGFIQEGKAEKAIAAIRAMIALHAVVRRGGQRQRIAVERLVPGDIVLLEAGDRVPADLRLVRVRGLLIDEAILTGESVAAAKREEPVKADAPLGDRLPMAYSGTLVMAGQGMGVVVATGPATEIGRISSLIGEVQPLTTPLLRQINRFARGFTWAAFVATAALFAFAVGWRGFGWTEALIAVVALAVGAIPEGLPAVITITLAIGVQRMATRNAVVRKLPAVETLGAVSVICSDKTGTLTRNEMTARRICLAGHEIAVGGTGYVPEGKLTVAGRDDDVASVAAAAPLLRAAILCNDAHLRRSGLDWVVDGDPMEGALIALASKAGLDPDHVRKEWPRIDEIPFDSQHRFMATLNAGPPGFWIFVKGAPERLLAMCHAQLAGDAGRPIDRAHWTRMIGRAAQEGERVLAFAAKRLKGAPDRLDPADLQDGLVFLGLVGFIDPPREEAIAAIAECRSAGIAVKMITGDHADTAAAIARQLGLESSSKPLTGADVDAIADDAFPAAVRQTSVFARTSPDHKLRIVRALQALGAVAAMTGDGVNDAPALKQADVGIAMGRKGTEAAKEAAEMVLLDDNFASIVAAVHEGRTVYDNIRKVIAWTLPTNGGEVVTVVAAILFGFTLPMSAVQILWVNLVTSVTLGLALAFEPAEADLMRRPPRRPEAPLLSAFLLWRVILVSCLFGGAVLGVFLLARGRGLDVETARTMVVNTIVVMEVFYLFSVRYLRATSISWRGLLGTPAVIVAVLAVTALQFLFTYAPVMQGWFGSRPVPLLDGIAIVLIGVALMLVLEGEKIVLRRLRLFAELA
jgi:magnesium-transporting ATPase (P-type)